MPHSFVAKPVGLSECKDSWGWETYVDIDSIMSVDLTASSASSWKFFHELLDV